MRGIRLPGYSAPAGRMTMRLRTKLILAFSGPLAILIVLGLISARTITKSSRTVERIFRENYDSADDA